MKLLKIYAFLQLKRWLSKLSEKEIEEIDVILFVSQTRDYIIPQTSGNSSRVKP